MYQHTTNKKNFNHSSDKSINADQFNQIVEAILEGKYSWACVLLLRFSGHNPLHYIPYRTYNRLAKENSQFSKPLQHRLKPINASNQTTEFRAEQVQKSLAEIKDLAYLEALDQHHRKLHGGSNIHAIDSCRNPKSFCLVRVKLLQNKIFSIWR